MTEGDPQAAGERRIAARHVMRHPFTCAERHPEQFRLVRRHEVELDRWFTQRLGYRLHVDADTARLYKSGAVPERRPLRAASGRPLTQVEHTMLALVLAATASGPSVISLRDLVAEVRSASAEAGVELPAESIERRVFVNALLWMIGHGLASELHEHVDTYATDETADAVLRTRPDRIALMLVPAVAGSETLAEMLERAERRSSSRQWMRSRLAEDPVLYRADLTDEEWTELRRRLGDEERLLDEMFGLVLESRAEGVAAIDPAGDARFPVGGTLGHAVLMLIERIGSTEPIPRADVDVLVAELAETHARLWSDDALDHPRRFTRDVVELMCDLRLAQVVDDRFRLLPGAARFLPVMAEPTHEQAALW